MRKVVLSPAEATEHDNIATAKKKPKPLRDGILAALSRLFILRTPTVSAQLPNHPPVKPAFFKPVTMYGFFRIVLQIRSDR